DNPLPGYVLANGIEANGRLLGLVYAGDFHSPDGEKTFVTAELLEKSINANLVKAGLVYVEPYDTMPISLIRHLRHLITQQRNANKGLWKSESITTKKSAPIPNLIHLEALIMWPKLFRRLASYFAEGHVGLSAFDDWIREEPVGRDDSLRIPDGEK